VARNAQFQYGGFKQVIKNSAINSNKIIMLRFLWKLR